MSEWMRANATLNISERVENNLAKQNMSIHKIATKSVAACPSY